MKEKLPEFKLRRDLEIQQGILQKDLYNLEAQEQVGSLANQLSTFTKHVVYNQ